MPIGGHNLLEPAALGVPVLTGPYTANSADIADLLVTRGDFSFQPLRFFGCSNSSSCGSPLSS